MATLESTSFDSKLSEDRGQTGEERRTEYPVKPVPGGSRKPAALTAMRPWLAGAWHSPQDFREQFPALSFHASAQRIIPAAVGSCPSKCSRLMLLVARCICPEDRLSKPKALGTLRRHVQMLKVYLAVMVVGAFGCAARMWLSNLLEEKYGPAFPIGTLAVNVLGCFIIGVFAGITRPDGGVLVHPVIRQAVIIGFLGGFTTFSSFGLQTISLLSDGEWGYAALNIILSVALCLAAVWIGQTIAVQIIRG